MMLFYPLYTQTKAPGTFEPFDIQVLYNPSEANRSNTAFNGGSYIQDHASRKNQRKNSEYAVRCAEHDVTTLGTPAQ